ncbi:MAG: hypothetical protein SGARI_005353 [Bacillariaceae sp.]
MKIFQTALFAVVLATSASAFTVAPRSGVATSFASRQELRVSLSEDNVAESSSEELIEEIKANSAEIDATSDTVETANEVASDGGEEDAILPPATVEAAVEHKVYVGNLPFTATQDAIRSVFQEQVNVVDVSLPINQDRVDDATGLPMCKGFAFVQVESEADLEKAIAAMNGYELEGRSMRVNKLLPKDKMTNMKSKRNMIPEGELF